MIKNVDWNGLKAVEISAGEYEALLIPSMGANLVKLVNTERGVDILRTPTKEEIETFIERPQIFGLPLLFPPNRIEDGTYTHNGVKYQYPITIPNQNNYHHGNIKSQAFTVTRCEEGDGYAVVEAVFFSNCVNDEMFRYFPHNLECHMKFRLSADGLEHTVTFVNLDEKEMPVGVGYHTPFNLPFVKGGNSADYLLMLSVGKRWELTPERTLPTGKLLDLTAEEAALRTTGVVPVGKPVESAFTAQDIDVDGKPYNGAVITDTKKNISVYYQVDSQMKHWTLWNNGGNVPWFCPEPQSWAINAPNLKLPAEVTGFATVPGKGSWSSTSRIYVK